MEKSLGPRIAASPTWGINEENITLHYCSPNGRRTSSCSLCLNGMSARSSGHSSTAQIGFGVIAPKDIAFRAHNSSPDSVMAAHDRTVTPLKWGALNIGQNLDF